MRFFALFFLLSVSSWGESWLLDQPTKTDLLTTLDQVESLLTRQEKSLQESESNGAMLSNHLEEAKKDLSELTQSLNEAQENLKKSDKALQSSQDSLKKASSELLELEQSLLVYLGLAISAGVAIGLLF